MRRFGALGSHVHSATAGEGALEPKDKAVQEAELSGEPREAVHEDQAADKEQKRAAEEFDGVEMLSEALIKLEKLADAESSEEKGNGQAGGIDGEQEDAAGDGVAGGRQGENRGEDGADAGRPAESEGKAEEKTAPDAGLGAGAAEVDIAIEPTGEGGAEESNDGKGEKMYGGETEKERPVKQQGEDSKDDQNRAKDDSDAHGELCENTQKMQAEQNDERAGDGSELGAMLAQEGADGAGGSSEGDKDYGEADDEGECGGEEASARLLAGAELFHADAGQHRDVARDERKDAGRKKRNEPGKECGGERDVSVHEAPKEIG